MTDTVHAIFNKLKKQLSTFLLHTYVKRKQAAHWHHAQAMIFTNHTWINNLTNFSMVVTSDDLNHMKLITFVFIY